jgi:hypothetical protein
MPRKTPNLSTCQLANAREGGQNLTASSMLVFLIGEPLGLTRIGHLVRDLLANSSCAAFLDISFLG